MMPPISIAARIETVLMTSDRRAPQSRRERMSRPKESVPNQCAAEGPCRRARMS